MRIEPKITENIVYQHVDKERSVRGRMGSIRDKSVTCSKVQGKVRTVNMFFLLGLTEEEDALQILVEMDEIA